MSTDRELLELAAKAAGINGWWAGDVFCYAYNGNNNVPVPWNPLTDDGDALRLAVKLHLRLDIVAYGCAVRSTEQGKWSAYEAHLHGGIEQATRQAIVAAAAEIGKAMP